MKTQLSNKTNLSKVIVQAYGEPTGFYELAAGIVGVIGGEISPQFVGKGFRQSRTNSDFRTSTHRFPEVLEVNNVNGSWVYTTDITAAYIEDVEEFLSDQRIQASLDPLGSLTMIPILIRTQNTVKDPITEEKTTTYFTPPQISDVGGSQFYGITSQVSRKQIAHG